MAKAPKKDRNAGEIIGLIRRILRENGRDYVWQYAVAAACMIVVGCSAAYIAWLVGPVIDDIFYDRRADRIVVICASVVGVFVLRGAATYVHSVVMARIGNNLIARYQQRIFDHLMKLGVDFYTDQRSGRLAAQINENVTGIRDLVGLTLTSIARDAVSLVALLGLMIWRDPLLSAITLVIGPPLVLGVAYIGRRLRSVTRQSVEINSRLIGAMQEATQGIAVVKAFTMESQLAERIKALIASAEGRSNKIASVTERLGPLTESLAGFALAGIIAYAGYRAIIDQVPPGAIASFITAFFLAYDPVRRLARVHVGLERALVNARMIYEILDLEPRQRDVPGAVKLDVSKGEVRFDGVTFAYGDNPPVLHAVSFVAEAGKTTAIVGASGAGKSTLVALLERFYDVHDGAILIDKQNIASVTKASLRQSMAFVSQQPYLFEGTIRDNIRYGRPDATDADTEFAAQKAAADGFIRQQPEGYETSVGENGVTLSGGQRQRLSIARAIVREAPILLLDEATSALDNESEAKVQTALTEVMRGRTTIVIAHRLSTVINADKIVVLEQGRVVEQGTHKQLLADPNGIYARFYRLQTDKGGLGINGDDDALAEIPARQRRTKA